MITDLLRGEGCKWCGRDLSRSFLVRVSAGVEKGDTILYPILCICGGITVIGAGTFISHFDDIADQRPTGNLNQDRRALRQP